MSTFSRKLDSETALPFQFHIDYAGCFGITAWELDRLKRKHTLGNIVNTAQTLNSLRRMLEKMENIVVGDVIRHRVEKSLAHLVEVRMTSASFST